MPHGVANGPTLQELTSECSDYSDDDSSMASDSSQDASS